MAKSFLLLTFFAIFVASSFGKDATDTKYAIGSEVVIASIRKIQDTCIFQNDLLFLRRLAYVQSKDGENLKSFWNSDTGRNGIWQTNQTMLGQVQSAGSQAASDLLNQLGININGMSWSNGDLDIPINDVAVARLYASLMGAIPLSIADQAAYWVNNFNPSGTTNQFIATVQEMPKCSPPGMDFMFIVDSSGSIGDVNFENVKNFLMTIITSLQSGQSNRVGIVRFSDNALLIQALTYDLNAAYQAAQNLVYDGGSTYINLGLDMALQQFQTYQRDNAPLVALLMTDGEPSGTVEDVTTSANNLKNYGVNLFTVGVGSAATADLLNWASAPHCMYYYTVTDFTQLAESFPDLLNSQICDVTAQIPSTQGCLNGFVDQGQYAFFQVPVDPTTGVTVKLTMTEGSASLYLSLTSRLPSGGDFDFTANANSEMPAQIYISPDQLQTGNNATIFAAVVGMGLENNYTLCNEKYDTVENYTTATPFTTNSSCISLDLIFILDQAQSVDIDYYNNNVSQFVINLANQFAFHDEATSGNPAYARFGVIQFSSDATVSIPLGNYSRNQYNNLVAQNVELNITDGTTRIDYAFVAAYNQFRQNGLMRNKAFILVVDDVTIQHIQDARDALSKLETVVTLPLGAIMAGTWGDATESYNHLSSLLGTKNTFPSITTSEDALLDLVDNTYPCTALPACSAIIFVQEATTVIGPHNKQMFLELVSKLINSVEHTPNQRFGLAQFATNLFDDIELMMFNDFNQSLNDAIRRQIDRDQPNGGTTTLSPVLTRLSSTINEKIYNSYSILLMGELERVRDVGPALKIAKSIAASGANIYVLDETQNLPNSDFWKILTNNAFGHVINGRNATLDLLYATFSQTIMPEFLARGC